MSNELATLQNTNAATVPALFDALTRSGGFLPRLQLYTKGAAVNHGKIRPGEFGIPNGDDVKVLGRSIDVVPLAWRAKAMDMSDKDAMVTNYDATSDVFKAIQAKSEGQDSGCMWGVSFLVFERTTGQFVEFFCGSKTSRTEAAKILPFTQPPRPMILGSRVVEKGNYSWHAPTIAECSLPFDNLPELEKVQAEVTKFLNPKAETAPEKVEEGEVKRRAR